MPPDSQVEQKDASKPAGESADASRDEAAQGAASPVQTVDSGNTPASQEGTVNSTRPSTWQAVAAAAAADDDLDWSDDEDSPRMGAPATASTSSAVQPEVCDPDGARTAVRDAVKAQQGAVPTARSESVASPAQ